MGWKDVCRPASQGGLGIKDMRAFNRALLNKWLWKFGYERSALWRRLVTTKYGEVPHGRKSKLAKGAMWCSLWKSISTGEESLFRHIRYKINNGERVHFWLNPWCERECLTSLFPNCYALAECKRGSVKDHMIKTWSFCLWNIQPKRNLNDWEIEEMNCLLALLECCTIGDWEATDEMVWVLEEEN